MYSSEPFLARWGKRTPVSCRYQTIALLDLIYFTKTATLSSTTQSRTSSHCQGTTPITKSSEAELSGNAKDVGHYTPTPTLGLAHHTLCLCLAPCGWCTWIVSWSTIDQRGIDQILGSNPKANLVRPCPTQMRPEPLDPLTHGPCLSVTLAL